MKTYKIITSKVTVISEGTSLLNAIMNAPYPASDYTHIISVEIL